ncbi:MAG TPA: phytanoyl-CoA dioxygenase family protein, partial [Vicinamibacterales bacterium]|nr:phytanoyl-CoA dioxygenase family protein [Vicinamibacterales bacterium]
MTPDVDQTHFQTFGFVVLRQVFDPQTLEDEVDRSLRDAFSSAVDAKVGGGSISFRYVPMMCERTPISLSLLDRLAQPAATLLGGPVLPVRAKGVLYSGATSWHSDDSGHDVKSVGFAAYLESLSGENGALRVVPGSQRSEFGRALERYVAGCQPGLTEQTREAWILTLPSVP